MKLIGLMAARNEEHIIGLTARAALMWCDELVILDHASTDDTPEIIGELCAEFGDRITAGHETDPVWREMEFRQRTLDMARSRGATHCAYVDADELLTANLIPHIRREIEKLAPSRFLRVPMPCMWRGISHYRDDTSVFGRALTMLAFADDGKVGWKPKEDGYQFHQREPIGSRQGGILHRDTGGLMHLQFSDWRRLLAKQALYKCQEVLRWPGRRPAHDIDTMYSQATNEAGARLTPAPASWFSGYDDLLRFLDLTADPWQESEVRRLVAEHGRERFEGLNLYGLEEPMSKMEPLNSRNFAQFVDRLRSRGVEVIEEFPEVTMAELEGRRDASRKAPKPITL